MKRWLVVWLAGCVGCAGGQVHVAQSHIARRLDELREDRHIRVSATSGARVRLSLAREVLADQNVLGESPLRLDVGTLIEGCALRMPLEMLDEDGVRAALEGRPCPLADTQFLTVGREPHGGGRRHLSGWVYVLVVIGGLAALSVVGLGVCLRDGGRC
jgi:hypothetical protein